MAAMPVFKSKNLPFADNAAQDHAVHGEDKTGGRAKEKTEGEEKTGGGEGA